MCNNLEYLKSINIQMRELVEKTKKTNEVLKVQLSEKLNSHMLDIGEYINQYSPYMDDMCKSMRVNSSKNVYIINNDVYDRSKMYSTRYLEFSFQNLKTIQGMMCRKMFRWVFCYCGSQYTICATISDTNHISFSGEFCVDDTIRAFKELLLVNKSLIINTIDRWITDTYRAVISEQVENMNKVESKLLRDCAMYGIS